MDSRYNYHQSMIDLCARKDTVDYMKKKMVTKDDKAFNVLAGAMQDALSQGQGLFLIRKMREGSFMWRVNEKDVEIDQKAAVE
jgi:hypothetical protein